MIVQESEADAGEMLEKSIWDAVSYLGNAIQTSTLYDGFTKCRLHFLSAVTLIANTVVAAQALIDGVQTADYEKGVDMSFATLEAVGKKAADLLAIEVYPSFNSVANRFLVG